MAVRAKLGNLNLSEETYNLAQEDGLLMLWRFLDDEVMRKVGEVKTCQLLFQKMDEVYLAKGGVEMMTAMFKLVNLKMNKWSEVENYITAFEELVNELANRSHVVVDGGKGGGMQQVWKERSQGGGL